MDVCDPNPKFNPKIRKITFEFELDGVVRTAHVHSRALDQMDGALGAQRQNCLAVYRDYWQMLHKIARAKIANGTEEPTIDRPDLPSRDEMLGYRACPVS